MSGSDRILLSTWDIAAIKSFTLVFNVNVSSTSPCSKQCLFAVKDVNKTLIY